MAPTWRKSEERVTLAVEAVHLGVWRRQRVLQRKEAAKLLRHGLLQLCDTRKMRRAQFFLVVARAAAILFFFCRNVSAEEPASSQLSFAEMDRISGVKGWNIGFPSFGDTLLQDYGGWRSCLASVGIGLIQYNSERFQANGLDTPRESPRFNPFYESAQIYWGQKPSFSNTNVIVLTYDLSRFGVLMGLNCTASPSQALYFGSSQADPSQRFEGNALNFQATLFTAF